MKLHIIRRTDPHAVERQPRVAIPHTFLKTWVKRSTLLLRKEKVRNRRLLTSDLTLVFVSAREMKNLNRQFRGKDYPTDVLSFAPSQAGSIGELALCLDVLRRQARAHRHPFREEIGYMVLHGLLHLLGYDHETSKSEAEVMFDIQDRIFDRLRRR